MVDIHDHQDVLASLDSQRHYSDHHQHRHTSRSKSRSHSRPNDAIGPVAATATTTPLRPIAEQVDADLVNQIYAKLTGAFTCKMIATTAILAALLILLVAGLAGVVYAVNHGRARYHELRLQAQEDRAFVDANHCASTHGSFQSDYWKRECKRAMNSLATESALFSAIGHGVGLQTYTEWWYRFSSWLVSWNELVRFYFIWVVVAVCVCIYSAWNILAQTHKLVRLCMQTKRQPLLHTAAEIMKESPFLPTTAIARKALDAALQKPSQSADY